MDKIEFAIYELLSEGLPLRLYKDGKLYDIMPTYEISHDTLMKIVSEKLKISEREVCEALYRLEKRGSIIYKNGFWKLRLRYDMQMAKLKKLLNLRG